MGRDRWKRDDVVQKEVDKKTSDRMWTVWEPFRACWQPEFRIGGDSHRCYDSYNYVTVVFLVGYEYDRCL